MDWQNSFVERERELAALASAWSAAKSGNPQLVGIVAEQGFGKTRLVQRFFETLSATEDKCGAEGWWPDSLDDSQAFDCVTPALREQPQGQMPFLWWGFRLRDPGDAGIRYATEISSARDTLRIYLRQQLSLHASRNRQRLIVGTGAKLAMDIAIEQAANAASLGFAGTLKSVGEAGKQIYDIQKADGRGPDHVNDIINDLRTVCVAPGDDCSPIPICIFVDDFQFLSADLEACRLLDELSLVARTERWPLLIIVTSWERGWKGGVNQTRIKNWGLQHTTLELSPLELGQLIADALPGLTPSQVALLLERAEGNPRSLKYLLANLIEDHRYLFEGRDPKRPLTTEGEAYVRSQTHDKVVAERFAGSPEKVKTLLAAASVQGIGFAPPIAIQMSKLLKLPADELGITQAERPYAFITVKGPDFAEFRQTNVWRAASAWLPNLAEPAAAQSAFQEALTSLAKDAEQKLAADSSDEVIVRERITDEDPWRRQEGRTALLRMFHRSRGRREFAVSAALAKRWLNSIDVRCLDDIRHAFDRRVTELGPVIEFLKQGPEREEVRRLLDDGFWQLLDARSNTATGTLAKFPIAESEFYDQRTILSMIKICACITLHAQDLIAEHIVLAAGEIALESLEAALSHDVIPIDWDENDNRNASYAQYNLVLYHDLLHAVNARQTDPARKLATENSLERIAPLMAKLPQSRGDQRLKTLLALQSSLRTIKAETANGNVKRAKAVWTNTIADLDEQATRSPEPVTLGMLAEMYALGLRTLHGSRFWPAVAKKQAVKGLEAAIRAYQAGLDATLCAESLLTLSMKAGRFVRESPVIKDFAPVLREDIRHFDQWVVAATGTSNPPFVPREVAMNHAQFCLASSYIQGSLKNRVEAISDLDLAMASVFQHLDYRRSLRNASISWRLCSVASARAFSMGKFSRWLDFLRQAKTIVRRAEEICTQHAYPLDYWQFIHSQVPDLEAFDAKA